MKQLFHIENNDNTDPQQVLSIRLGEKHASFAITNKTGDKLFQLAYCTGDEWDGNELGEFLAAYPALSNNFYQVMVAYDHPQAVLTPNSCYKTDDAASLLKCVYGTLVQSDIISEAIAEWQLYNVYAVPKEIHERMTRKYRAEKFWHQYSLSIKGSNNTNSAGCLLADFRKEDFTLLAIKNGQLLIAQAFLYSTPDDVLYYLLKVCEQFSLSRQEVALELSGLIDKGSALYKEIYQYFINVNFREPSWEIPESEYPLHFFTSLNDLAKCAS